MMAGPTAGLRAPMWIMKIWIKIGKNFIFQNDDQESWQHMVSLNLNQLTCLPLDKMATILADDIFKCIFFNENDWILIQISLKFVYRSPIDNEPTLVGVMAWHWTGDKSLPESMLTQFPDAYMQH